ncbi:MAG: LacI family DNA-binding transcriptional regulator [Stackebrandtia sp.]
MSTDSSHASKRLSLRDVAAQAGVAVSTVSRVLSDHPDISTRTRERVLAVVAELGYRPNVLGQMLRQGATRTVGFVIGDISNPLLAQIALGAETALGTHDYALLLSNSMSDLEQERKNLRNLEQRQVDGLLLSVTDEIDPELISILDGFAGPMVSIDRTVRLPGGIGSVYSDHTTGIQSAIAAFAEAGHEEIVLITGLATLRPGRQRIQAAREAASWFGLRCAVEAGAGPTGPDTGDIAALLTRDKPRPTAVIAGNNQITASVLAALERAGLSYPRDVSLVTCDEVSLQQFIKPRIGTIRRDPFELGKTAAELLLEGLTGGTESLRHIELPTSFEPGDSIAAPPAS